MTKKIIGLRKLFISIWALCLIILTVLLISNLDNNNFYSEVAIRKVWNDASNDFRNIIFPIADFVSGINKDISEHKISEGKESGLKKYFFDKIKKSGAPASIFYADNTGVRFLIYRDNNSFVYAYKSPADTSRVVELKRFTKIGKNISEWKENFSGEKITDNLFSGKDKIYGQIRWSFSDENFALKSPALSADFYQKITDKIIFVSSAIDISGLKSSFSSLKNFSNFTLLVKGFENNLLEINFKAGRANIRISKINNPITKKSNSDFFSEWAKLDLADSSSIAFSEASERWIGRVEHFGDSKKLYFGIAVEESELKNSFSSSGYIFAALIALLLITGIIFFAKNNSVKSKFIEITDVNEIIEKGENKFIEFKSSLRWDYRNKRVSRQLEEVIMKSISAFANAEGGYLVIGVDDDKNILGLENDFQSLQKNSEDYFEIHIRNLINSYFGINFTSANITISFPRLSGKTICVIKILPSDFPVYVTLSDKSGRKEEKFFIRSGNSSVQIKSLEEITNFINRRFK